MWDYLFTCLLIYTKQNSFKENISKLISGKWYLILILLLFQFFFLNRIIGDLYCFLSEMLVRALCHSYISWPANGPLGEPGFVQNPGWLRLALMRRCLSLTLSLGGPWGSSTEMASHSWMRMVHLTPWYLGHISLHRLVPKCHHFGKKVSGLR